jgi:hypothetical protein
MDADIDYASLKGQIAEEHPDLAEFLRREKPSRPNANGDWEGVIVHGFKASPLPDGRASARDLTDLIDFTLTYLSSCQPASSPRTTSAAVPRLRRCSERLRAEWRERGW